MPENKPCPFCGEQILMAAAKCRFCGEFVDASRKPPRPRSGFPRWAIVLIVLVVGGFLIVPIIAFIAAATSSLRRSRVAANETAAMASLKQLVATEGVWRQTDADGNGQQDYWVKDVAGFHYMKDTAGSCLMFIDAKLARADPDGISSYIGLPPMSKAGYWFSAIPLDRDGRPLGTGAQKVTHPSEFGFCAYPEKYNSTGLQTYIVNEEGTLYMMDNGGTPVNRWPGADPATTGWAESE